MTTFFIPQPMNEKTDDEIKADGRKVDTTLLKPVESHGFKFQPMPKRFMVWDKGLSKFYAGSDGKACVFDIWSLIEFLNNSQRYPEQLEIVQFTDLFDEDGKEIFEGDIVTVENNIDKFGLAAGRSYVVDYRQGGWCLQPILNYTAGTNKKGWALYDGQCVKIIGHILSNPELLEEKDV